MIEDIKGAFKQILPNLAWMDDETRKKAIEKVVIGQFQNILLLI